VYRAHLPAPIEWRCISCGDEGFISGWEGSPFDLRRPGSNGAEEDQIEVLLGEEVAETLRGIQVFDADCERVVFAARADDDCVLLSATEGDVEALAGIVAAEANNEADRRRRKRLDAAFSVLDGALVKGASSPTETLPAVRAAWAAQPEATTQVRALPRRDVRGRWRIVEMDIWDRGHLDLEGPAFIEFGADRTGSFGFIAVTAWMDWRAGAIDGRPGAEFSFQGSDEGDEVSGRGRAVLLDDGTLEGHLYFHMGDDSGFRAVAAGAGLDRNGRRRR
jgi:hypothetical protein